MKIANKIASAVKNGIQNLYGTDVPETTIQLQETRPEFEGQLTLVVFPFLKISKKKPEDTAQDLGAYLKNEIPEILKLERINCRLVRRSIFHIHPDLIQGN